MLIFLFLYLCIPWKVTTPELYFSFYNCHLNILSGLLFIVGSLFTLLFIFMINTYIVFTKITSLVSLERVNHGGIQNKINNISTLSVILQVFYLGIYLIFYFGISIIPSIYHVYYLDRSTLILEGNLLKQLSTIVIFFWNCGLFDKIQIILGSYVFRVIFHFIFTFIIGMMYEVFKYSDIFFYAILFKIYFFTNMSKCIELSFLFPLGFIFTYLTFIKSLLRNSIFRYLFLIENIFAIITGIIPFLLIIYTYQYKLLSLFIIVYGVLHIFILKKVRKQIYI